MKLVVADVDGEKEFVMYSLNKSKILKFLQRYDHEGSSISIDDDDDMYFGEAVYEFLKDKNGKSS